MRSSDAMSQQQVLIRDAQHQALGSKAVPQLKPAETLPVPSVASQSPLVLKRGCVHFQPPVRASDTAAVAGGALQVLIEPFPDMCC